MLIEKNSFLNELQTREADAEEEIAMQKMQYQNSRPHLATTMQSTGNGRYYTSTPKNLNHRVNHQHSYPSTNGQSKPEWFPVSIWDILCFLIQIVWFLVKDNNVVKFPVSFNITRTYSIAMLMILASSVFPLNCYTPKIV